MSRSVRALIGVTLCSAGVLTAAPLSPAAAAPGPQPAPAPSAAADIQVRPQGVPARRTAATGTPPQIAYSVIGRGDDDPESTRTATAVARLNPLTGQARTVIANRGRLLQVDAWSDDRARIYYDVVDVPVLGDAVTGNVDSVPQAGGAARRERTGALGLDVSRDGRRLVYARSERGVTNIFTSDAAGRGERRVTGRGGASPRFSPDGSRIVFTRRSSPLVGQADVYTVRTDGTGLTRVTGRADTQDFDGAFSPDGRRVLFTRFGAGSTRPSVYAAGIDGSGLRLVRAGASDADWASNGWITYLTQQGRGDGTLQQQVAVRAPGVPGVETVLTRERNVLTGVRFAG